MLSRKSGSSVPHCGNRVMSYFTVPRHSGSMPTNADHDPQRHQSNGGHSPGTAGVVKGELEVQPLPYSRPSAEDREGMPHQRPPLPAGSGETRVLTADM